MKGYGQVSIKSGCIECKMQTPLILSDGIYSYLIQCLYEASKRQGSFWIPCIEFESNIMIRMLLKV